MTLLVMMEGVPGSGKSTLAEGLVRLLHDAGRRAAVVPEECIFEADEFAAVGDAFRTKNWPSLELMLDAYEKLLGEGRRDLVFDWNALGMVEDLPCTQADGSGPTGDDPDARADSRLLIEHARDVGRLWRGELVLLLLEMPVASAGARALRERGQEWLHRELVRVPRTLEGRDALDRVNRFREQFEPRRDQVVAAYISAGWSVASIDASGDAETVCQDAFAAIMTVQP